MSKFIQSFYSGNCIDFTLFTHNCFFCLSSIYAKNSGIDIDIFTDYEFAQLIDRSQHKSVNILFDNHDEYAKIDSLVWAWPKFIALDRVSRDTIHLDGDVFLKDNSLLNRLTFDGHDVICQHLEHKSQMIYQETSYQETFECIKHVNYPEDITKAAPEYMPNNGVLGISNEKLWTKYRDYYWQMCSQCPPGSIIPIGWCVPDIIFEQYFLKEICDKDGYTIKFLLTGKTLDELNNEAKDIHFQHICSNKYLHLQKCINLIYKKDKVCYEMIKSNWEDKFPEYFQ